MTIRHFAIALAVVVLGLPLLAMSFFLLPVLLPLALAAPFLIARIMRQASQPDVSAALVREPPGSMVSLGQHGIALVPQIPQLRREVSVEQPRAA